MNSDDKIEFVFERDGCPGILAHSVAENLKRLGLSVEFVKETEDEIRFTASREAR